jgi:hypothetical protein
MFDKIINIKYINEKSNFNQEKLEPTLSTAKLYFAVDNERSNFNQEKLEPTLSTAKLYFAVDNEHFTDTFPINNNIIQKRTFENNQNIDSNMAITSLTKLTNNIVNSVVQNNAAEASAAVAALNSMWLSGVECETITLNNINQSSNAQSQTNIQITQSNINKISSSVTSTIDKTIQTNGGTDINTLQAPMNDALKDYAKTIPNFNSATSQNMTGACSSSILNTANCPTGQNNNFTLDSSIKNYLKLDDSFKITDSNNIDNEINNKINQSNVANCSSSASSANQIILNDIQCDVASASGKSLNPNGKLTISDIEQKAVAKLFMTCIINQSNVSEISTKILNKISSKYNQIYDAVAKKAQETNDPEYYNNATKFLDTLSAAGMEQINAAAGNLPPKNPQSTPPPVEITTPTANTPPPASTTPANTPPPASTTPANTPPASTTPASTTPPAEAISSSTKTTDIFGQLGGIIKFPFNLLLLLFCLLFSIGIIYFLLK